MPGTAPDITFYPDDWTGDRDPWLKFYPDLWNGDLGLMSCSPAAQALLARLMGVLHHAKPYAFLTFTGEKVGVKCRSFEDVLYLKSVSKAAGVSVKTFQKLLSELVDNGALKVHPYGIYSKRMRLEWEKTQKGRQTGKGGGNPALTPSEDKGGVNPPVKGGLNTRYKTKNKKKTTPSAREDFASEFEEEFWPLVVKSETHDEALELFVAIRTTGFPLEDLVAGLLEYQREKSEAGWEPRYYMQPKRFLGSENHWQEYAARADIRRDVEEEQKRRLAEREAVEEERKRRIAERKPSPAEQAARDAFLQEAQRNKLNQPEQISAEVPDDVRLELEEKRKSKLEREAVSCTGAEKTSATTEGP